MSRDLLIEKEMESICQEIWQVIGKSKLYDGYKKFPRILSKQGGSSACYYPSEHTVYFRWNVVNKYSLGGKRLIAIHELWHAAGHDHNRMFTTSFDLLSIELYKLIYGEDEHFKAMVEGVHEVIKRELVNH